MTYAIGFIVNSYCPSRRIRNSSFIMPTLVTRSCPSPENPRYNAILT